MQRAVVSVDGTGYLEWQSQLLARTYQDIGQPGPLTRLWASDSEPTPWPWDTFVTPNYTGYSKVLPYCLFNRIIGIRDWCRSGLVADDDTVLMVDPDMVFIDKLEISVPHGTIMGSDWSFLRNCTRPDWEGFVSRNCTVPAESIPRIGTAYACSGRSLSTLYELLVDRTIQLQHDDDPCRGAHWVDEMWATAFLLAELGWDAVYPESWVSEVYDFNCNWPAPILHYPFQVKDGWTWEKRYWKPGDPIPPYTEKVAPAARILADLLVRHEALLRATVT